MHFFSVIASKKFMTLHLKVLVVCINVMNESKVVRIIEHVYETISAVVDREYLLHNNVALSHFTIGHSF